MDVRRVKFFTFRYRVVFVTYDNCGHRDQIPGAQKDGGKSVNTGRRRSNWAGARRAAYVATPRRARRSRRLGSNPSETGVLVVHVYAGADV